MVVLSTRARPHLRGLKPVLTGDGEVHVFSAAFAPLIFGHYLMLIIGRLANFNREIRWQIGGPGLLAIVMARYSWSSIGRRKTNSLISTKEGFNDIRRASLSINWWVVALADCRALIRLWWVRSPGRGGTARIKIVPGDGAESLIRGEIRDRNGVARFRMRQYEVDFY